MLNEILLEAFHVIVIFSKAARELFVLQFSFNEGVWFGKEDRASLGAFSFVFFFYLGEESFHFHLKFFDVLFSNVANSFLLKQRNSISFSFNVILIKFFFIKRNLVQGYFSHWRFKLLIAFFNRFVAFWLAYVRPSILNARYSSVINRLDIGFSQSGHHLTC